MRLFNYLCVVIAETDSDKSNLPSENAPPPSYTSIVKESGPPGRPPPPCPKQAPAIPPRPEENMFDFSDKPPESSPFDDVYEVSYHTVVSLCIVSTEVLSETLF